MNNKVASTAYLCDLHTHTSSSDGQYSAKALTVRAINEGLCALAITDHDTTAGWESLCKADFDEMEKEAFTFNASVANFDKSFNKKTNKKKFYNAGAKSFDENFDNEGDNKNTCIGSGANFGKEFCKGKNKKFEKDNDGCDCDKSFDNNANKESSCDDDVKSFDKSFYNEGNNKSACISDVANFDRGFEKSSKEKSFYFDSATGKTDFESKEDFDAKKNIMVSTQDGSPVIHLGAIEVIKGVELSVEFPTGECHILGLGIKKVSLELSSVCKKLQEGRVARNKVIVQKLNECGIGVSLEEIEKEVFERRGNPSLIVGRPHIAQYLARHGFVKNEKVAFEKYLGKGRPCFCERLCCTLSEAVAAIKSSGAVAVLAHPMSLYVSFSKLPSVIKNFHSAGITGLEAYHPSATLAQCKRLEALARAQGLFVTAGSDFHGELIRSDRCLARTAGGLEISAKWYFTELLPNIE